MQGYSVIIDSDYVSCISPQYDRAQNYLPKRSFMFFCSFEDLLRFSSELLFQNFPSGFGIPLGDKWSLGTPRILLSWPDALL